MYITHTCTLTGDLVNCVAICTDLNVVDLYMYVPVGREGY